MKRFLARRLMVLAALLSPFIVALFYTVSAAQAALIRGRGASRMQFHAGGVHGTGSVITITLIALALIATTYVGLSRGLRKASALSEPVALPLRSDSSADEDRKAA